MLLSLRFAVLLLAVASCFAQSAAELNREASQRQGAGDFAGAQERFERALALAIDANDPRQQAEARRGLGYILNRSAKFAEARTHLEQALVIYRQLGDHLGAARVTNGLAHNAWGGGDLKTAHGFYRSAIAEYEAAGEEGERAEVFYNLAFTAPNHDERLKLIEQGLDLARRLANRRLQGQLLHMWGDVLYLRDGDFAAAMEKLELAIKLLDTAAARSQLAAALTSMGRLHRVHGQYERALEFYRRAAEIQRATSDRVGEIQSVEAMGVAYEGLGRHREALVQFQQALEMARKTGSPAMLEARLGSLGAAYVKLREYARAVEVLEEAGRLPSLGATGRELNLLSQAYMGLGRYADALHAADASVQKSNGSPEFLPTNLQQRAVAHQKLGHTPNALDDAKRALESFEQLRTKLVPSDYMKRGFPDKHRELFAFAIGLYHQAGQADQALGIAEQARARAFLDLLATREVQPPAARRPQLAAVRELEKRLQAKGLDPSAPSSPLQTRGADPETASLWKQWQNSDPELRSLVSAAPFSAAQMTASAVRLRSTILAYWVGSDAIFLWVVPPDGKVASFRIDVAPARLRQLIRQTWPRASGQSRSPSEGADAPEVETWLPRMRGSEVAGVLDVGGPGKKPWRELHDLLIRPARRLLPKTSGARLTIVPHGPLFQVSFAALLDERDRYLAESYTLHYAPAGAVLDFTHKRQEQISGRPPRYLLVADPSKLPSAPSGKALPPLPGSRREVQAIARLLPAGAATILAGGDAREENFRALLADQTVIHFATHGVLLDDAPFDSFLALGATGSASAGDGRLSAREIYELDLQADLVVLSACRSALGRISGDGIAGLTRSFFYAGTPSVLATLWDVSDEPTARLISDFYRSFQRSHDKSRALRDAQLRLLRALRAGQVKVETPAGPVALPEHPIFWAGFVLLGEPQ